MGRQPRDLIHLYGKEFEARAAKVGITSVRTPPRSPKRTRSPNTWSGPFAREVLDHIIVIN